MARARKRRIPDAGKINPPKPPATTAEKVALVCILLTAIIARLPGLCESLWYDEIFYTTATFKQPGLLSFLLWKDVHPPFYTIVLLAWTSLFGDGETIVRVPVFICGLLSIILIWDLTRRWLGPRQALLAAALLALSPPHIWYSHENKVNMLVLLLTVAMVRFYSSAVEDGRRRDWIAATIVLILALYTHAYALPVAGTVFLWLFWLARVNSRIRGPMTISGIVAVLVWAPLALLKLSQLQSLERGYLRQLSPGELYKLLLVWLPHGNTIRTINPYQPFAKLLAQPWPYFLVDAFFAFLLVRGLARAWRAAHGEGWTSLKNPTWAAWQARLLLLWFIPPVVLTFAVSLVKPHFYIERNLLVVLPPFVLLLVMGTDGLSRQWARMALPAVLLAFSSVAVFNLLFVKSNVWTVYKFKPDWRAAAGYLGEEMERHGTLRVFATTPMNEFSYYGPRLVFRKSSPGSKPQILLIDFCRIGLEKSLRTVEEKGTDSFYLVYNSTWKDCWDSAWRAFSIDPRFKILESRDFKGLTIYKFGWAGAH